MTRKSDEQSLRQHSARGRATPTRSGTVRGGAPREDRTTISVSIPVTLADRTADVAHRTQWAQSHVVANALELYAQLSTAALYRVHELRGRLGAERLRTAVAEAIEREVDRLEWQAVAEETTRELEERLPDPLSEGELVTHARAAIAESRAARRVRLPDGQPVSRPPARR